MRPPDYIRASAFEHNDREETDGDG